MRRFADVVLSIIPMVVTGDDLAGKRARESDAKDDLGIANSSRLSTSLKQRIELREAQDVWTVANHTRIDSDAPKIAPGSVASKRMACLMRRKDPHA